MKLDDKYKIEIENIKLKAKKRRKFNFYLWFKGKEMRKECT